MKQGRPKSKEEPTEQVATRIPVTLKKQIAALAKAEKRSFASMLRNLIEAAVMQ